MTITRVTPTNLEMFAGDTRVLHVTVLDQDSAVVDITGATVNFMVSKRRTTSPLFTKTVGSGVVISDGPNGEMDITLDPADTTSLKGAHYFECEVTDVSSRKTTVLYGTLSILRSING